MGQAICAQIETSTQDLSAGTPFSVRTGKMELNKEQKSERLEKLLHSRTLQISENLKAFLRFVVETSVADVDAHLKDSTSATEVVGR